MPTIEFQGDDGPALEYIRKRGYVSYSSLKLVRDKEIPYKSDAIHFVFGGELHSRCLEHLKTQELDAPNEVLLTNMRKVLWAHPIWRNLLEEALTEVEIKDKVLGVPVLAYIDILCSWAVGDLKTTALTNPAAFAQQMDFLQAALYLLLTGKKDFYYIGISKKPPHKVMIFNVNQYPERLQRAKVEAKELLKYVKAKLEW